jgi:hypothetical protein
MESQNGIAASAPIGANAPFGVPGDRSPDSLRQTGPHFDSPAPGRKWDRQGMEICRQLEPRVGATEVSPSFGRFLSPLPGLGGVATLAPRAHAARLVSVAPTGTGEPGSLLTLLPVPLESSEADDNSPLGDPHEGRTHAPRPGRRLLPVSRKGKNLTRRVIAAAHSGK